MRGHVLYTCCGDPTRGWVPPTVRWTSSIFFDKMYFTAIDIDEVRTAEERALREASDRVIKNRIKDLEVVTVDGKDVL